METENKKQIYIVMKKTFLLFSILSISFFAISQPNWSWVKSAGASGDDQAVSISRDSQGNAFVTGHFNGTVSFGSGNSLISSGGSDMFIARYNSNGGFMWAKKAGSNADDKGLDIKVDDEGNIFVLGWHGGTAFFGTEQINNADGAKSFLAKYDNTGQVIWVKKLGGYARTFDIDSDGNIYIAASFGGTIKVDDTQITANGYDDAWLGKFNSSGSLQWIKRMYGSNGYETPISLTISHDGHPLLLGRISGVCSFEGVSSSIANSGGQNQQDMFLVKYNSNGNFGWVKQFTSTTSTESTSNTLICDNGGNIYFTGTFSNTLNIGSHLITSKGSSDAFVAKLSSDGETAHWVSTIATTKADGATGIGLDGSGNVYISGFYSDTLSIGNILLANPGTMGAFVAKFNNNGEFQWAKPANSTGSDAALGIHVVSDGSALVCGRFSNSANFHGTEISSQGGYDIFVAKSEITFTPPLKALFTASQTDVPQGSTVQFTDQSTGSPSTWTWTIEGVTPSVYDSQNPSVTYSTVGTYDVKLEVSNLYGETSTLSKTAYINVTPYVSPCNAIKFDGIDDYVDCGNRSTLRLQSNFTIEAWINPEAEQGFPLAFMNLTDDYKNGYGFGYVNGKLRFLVHPLSMDVAEWEDLPGANIPLDTWSHVAGTYDGKEIKFYLNGQLVESKTTSNMVQGILWNSLPTGLYLGRYMATTPADAAYFKGAVDDVRIWRTVRTEQQIASTYDAKLVGNEQNLSAYWPLNEGEGTTAIDATANAFVANLKNGPQWIASNTACWGVGIDENQNNKYNVYPNPTNNFIYIDNISEISTIEIFDIKGQKLESVDANKASLKIDISNFNNGIYLLRITNSSGTAIHKIIKQ